MKIWILSLLATGLAFPAAHAQWERRSRPVKARNPAAAPAAAADTTHPDFFVSTFYSSANQVSYKGDVSLPTYSGPFDATESTAGALGLAGGYRRLRADQMGFDVYGAFELPRKSSGIQGTAGPNAIAGTYSGDVSTSLLSLVLNGNYSIGERFYLSAGINFPVVFTSNNMDLSGLPGFQAGVGAKVYDRFSIQLDYRVLRMKGTIDVPPMKLQIEEANFPGILFFVHYSL